jgi:hypothetical protein
MLPLQLLAKLCHYATPFLALSNLDRRLTYVLTITSLQTMSTTFLKKSQKNRPRKAYFLFSKTKLS